MLFKRPSIERLAKSAVVHSPDLEDIVRTHLDAIAFALTAPAVDDRPPLARLGAAVLTGVDPDVRRAAGFFLCRGWASWVISNFGCSPKCSRRFSVLQRSTGSGLVMRSELR